MELIKITPNRERAKGILKNIELIEKRIQIQDKKTMPSLIVSDYYEIIKELICAILYIDGYKCLSHKELIEYLKINYDKFEKYLIYQIDNLRIIRNKISYDGYSIKKKYIDKNEDFFKKIIVKLKEIINSKLNNSNFSN
jgi:hypothetical protein